MNQPMFSITGNLLHAYKERQLDKSTGEEVARYRIQILGNIPLRDGSGVRSDLVTLTVQSLADYQDLVGRLIRVPFGFFAPGKGNVITFVPKGSKPQALDA